ncbi:MAG: hypothetical protein JW395_3755 [Nitrospira sp.]|nr:hypothetical protein [Nitrospira sp.]
MSQSQPNAKTEMLTFRGTARLRELLDRCAKRGDLSRSDLIRETLERECRANRS